MIPKASENLYAYKQWRKSLVPFNVGTVLHWKNGYAGSTFFGSIKPGQCTKIVGIRKSNGVSDMETAIQEYTCVLCNKDGSKVYKKTFYWRVEGIAHNLTDGNVEVIK